MAAIPVCASAASISLVNGTKSAIVVTVLGIKDTIAAGAKGHHPISWKVEEALPAQNCKITSGSTTIAEIKLDKKNIYIENLEQGFTIADNQGHTITQARKDEPVVEDDTKDLIVTISD